MTKPIERLVGSVMLSVEDVRAKALRLFERDRSKRVADLVRAFFSYRMEEQPVFEVPLHPPRERIAVADMKAVQRWIDDWRAYHPHDQVIWETRRWASVGVQQVPTRIVVHGIPALARCAHKAKQWSLLERRVKEVCELVVSFPRPQRSDQFTTAGLAEASERLAAAIKTTSRLIVDYDAHDWRIACLVISWLANHPDATCFVRELPIRGIDTKWIELHRALAEPLARACLGCEELPFKKPVELIRLRFLDPSLANGGLREFAASALELSSLKRHPSKAIVCENLVSMLSLPSERGAVALFGKGYSVGNLAHITWLREIPILYWGDIDSNSFAILNRLRSHHPHVVSFLMDCQTLHDFRDLCSEEPKPNLGSFEHLIEEEQETLAEILAVTPALRLEQERIAWDYVKSALEQAWDALGER